MLRRNSGHIVNVSSVGSRFVWPGATAYLAARWAVRAAWTPRHTLAAAAGWSLVSTVPPAVSSSGIATNNMSVAMAGWAGGAALGLGALYVILLNGFLLGLILAEATNTAPFALLLLINYFSALPRELEEAAQVDGCGRLRTLVRIVLPLAVPGLVAAELFAFIAAWNNFLFAFLFTTTDRVKTLPIMMRLFALGEPAVWGVSAAGAILTTLPIVLLFLLFQRMLMSGLAAGAVKG
jgi:ABC-type maltose transport system permease subunit